ncbi:TauD/TfdA family dioxygenase [Pseudonocardia sp. GCM10023141]|uniref:2-trimethylaminoethylphosphonate dioxygenase n=1 Tax=Pseudonocardia sp. GCM10023141 TaxID=3252653 RepID=UPI003606BC2E
MSAALTTDPTRQRARRLDRWPAIWLRDNCRCTDCRDPRNGQKLFGITDLPARPEIVGVTLADDERDGPVAIVEFAPPHRGSYPLSWLDAVESTPVDDGRTENGKALWAAGDLDGRLPSAGWQDHRDRPAERLRVLDAVRSLGFALLRDVPTRPGTVLDVAATFGFVRTTNYGDLFDVRVQAQPNNLAFTSSRITPHTDNPYRDPVPTIQLLHCLENAAVGGDSGLVDGFHAAALLRAEHPEAFAVLTRTPVPFRFADADTVLLAERPMIDVDPLGRIREVRFNNRSIQPMVLPAEELVAFYDAYRTFAELIDRPELRLDLRLEPGDCLVFDNVRLLHARTAYAESGARHLQGCYADLDALHSSAAVLRAAVTA